MKLCQYDEHQAGAVRGERVFPVGAALVAAGHLRPGYTMQEVIEALANRPQAVQCAVIGTRARRVSEAQALEHVFGYTICWDISQRDPWGRGRQNTRNIRKGFDTFTALGPWIVTRDELPEPQDVRIEVELNGRP